MNKFFSFLNQAIPLYILVIVIIIGILSGFGLYPMCNPEYHKPQIVYVDTNTTHSDTSTTTTPPIINTSPAIVSTETNVKDTTKVNFTATDSLVLDSLDYIKSVVIFESVSKEIADELSQKKANFSIKYKLPTITNTNYVPLHLDKSEACMYQSKGALYVVISEVVVGAIIGTVWYLNR